MESNTEHTREKLIEICERAFVPQQKWANRDSASSHIGLGSCHALLKSGCEFEIQYTKDGSGCNTDERMIWIQFFVHDFMWFEGDRNDSKGNKSTDYHFYIPTEQRLNETQNGDWY